MFNLLSFFKLFSRQPSLGAQMEGPEEEENDDPMVLECACCIPECACDCQIRDELHVLHMMTNTKSICRC